MNFKSLSSLRLHEETLMAAKNEKAATLRLLEFLAEVDARRLYGERGYSTLFDYVHRALGYSEASASERISAMRIMEAVPEVKVKIAAEELTLTAAVKLASFVKREDYPPSETVKLLDKISGCSTRELERVLAREQSVPVLRPDHFKASGPETTRVSFDADPEFMAMFERLKNLQGNPGLSMCERLKQALRTEVERKEKFKPRPRTQAKKAVHPEGKAPVFRAPELEQSARTNQAKREDQSSLELLEAAVLKPADLRAEDLRLAALKPTVLIPAIKPSHPKLRPSRPIIRSRFIPLSVKRAVAERSGARCEFVDPVSGRRCESRFGLEFDHFPKPFAHGGESELTNLRHVCSSHNKLAAIRSFGRAKMRAYFR